MIVSRKTVVEITLGLLVMAGSVQADPILAASTKDCGRSPNAAKNGKL